MPPPALVSVTTALRYFAPDVAALPHISLSVSIFLDVSVYLSLKEAAASGSLRLFRRVLTRLHESTPPIDEFLLEDYLSKSMAAAARGGHLDIVQQIHEVHAGKLDAAPLSIAAKQGDIVTMRWLIENRRDDWRCVPSPDEREVAIEVLDDPPRCCLNELFGRAWEAHQFAVIKWLIEHGYQWPEGEFLCRISSCAARIGDLDAVKWLHELNEPNAFSTRAIDDAVRGGHTEVVAFLLANRTEGYTATAQCYAAIGGYGNILELLQSPLYQHLRRGPPSWPDLWAGEAARAGQFDLIPRDPLAPKLSVDRLHWVAEYACEQGRLDALEWLVAIDASTLGANALRIAAKHGHLHILQLVHERGIRGLGGNVLHTAAEFGHLHIVQWFHQHYSNAFASSTMDIAAARGHQEIVEWLHFNRCDGCSQDAMDGAAISGHLQLVQWLHEHRTEGCTTRAMDQAAQNGRHDMIKWLHFHRTEGCTTKAMDGAAANGDLELVIWLHQHRSEGCTTAAMDGAATKGNLELVKWLHAHQMIGCTTAAMDCAATRGHLDVVKWLHEHRTEGCTRIAMDGAAMRGDLEMVIWLHEHRSEGCTARATDNSPLYVAKWVHFNRTEGCTTAAMDLAARNGDLAKLLFMHKYRTEGCTAQGAVNAAQSGHLYIVQWLRYHYPQNFDRARVSRRAEDVPHIRSWLTSTEPEHSQH